MVKMSYPSSQSPNNSPNVLFLALSILRNFLCTQALLHLPTSLWQLCQAEHVTWSVLLGLNLIRKWFLIIKAYLNVLIHIWKQLFSSKTQLYTGTFRITFFVSDIFTTCLSVLCAVVVCYLAEEADVETKRLGIPWASIHVIANQQHQLQEFTEAFTLLHFLTSKCHIHDVWPDVIHLLLERQLEQNAVETWP